MNGYWIWSASHALRQIYKIKTRDQEGLRCIKTDILYYFCGRKKK